MWKPRLDIAVGAAVMLRTCPGWASCDTFIDACVDRDVRWTSVVQSSVVSVNGHRLPDGTKWQFALDTHVQWPSLRLAVPRTSPTAIGAQRVFDVAVDTEAGAAFAPLPRLLVDVVLSATPFQQGVGVTPVRGAGALPTSSLRDSRASLQWRWTSPHTASESTEISSRITLAVPTGSRTSFRTDGVARLALSMLIAKEKSGWTFASDLGLRSTLGRAVGPLGTRTDVQVVGVFGVSRATGRRGPVISSSLLVAPSLWRQEDAVVTSSGDLSIKASSRSWIAAEFACGAQFHAGLPAGMTLNAEAAVPVPLGAATTNPASTLRVTAGMRWALR